MTDPNGESLSFNEHTVWQRELLAQMFQLMHRYEKNNFDSIRYRGIDPNIFHVGQHVDYFLFFLDNSRRYFEARALLDDQESRTLYDQLILFRILGHTHVRLPFNMPEAIDYDSRVEPWKVRETSDVGLLGPLAIYAVPTDEGELRMKCWGGNVAASILFGQYFFHRGLESIAPQKGDVVIDAGGCFGDTALVFASAVGNEGRVLTFDPLRKHCKIMRESFEMNPRLKDRIRIFEVGLTDQDNAGAASSHDRDSIIDPGARVASGGDLPTRSIDSLVRDGEVSRIDYINMDIEGSELSALVGAESSIRTWTPKLAISLYHRADDLFLIPIWLHQLGCGYRFFLDHYSIHHEETVLYARVHTN
jgi:FkbM family methyltransferase